MIQQKVLIDTDILSAIMLPNPIAIVKAIDYLNQHNKFTFSLITRYEILRGLKAKAASKQLIAFETFCTNNIIVPVTDEIIVKAADIYAHLRRQGFGLCYAMDGGYKGCNPYIERHLAIFVNCFCSRAN